MSATIVTTQPAKATTTDLKSIMQRHPVMSYIVLMFIGLWLGYLPLLLSSQGFGVFEFKFPFPAELFNIPASLLGPLVAGLVMASVTGGKAGRQQFVKRLFKFKFGVRWYLIAIDGVVVLGILSVAAVQGVASIVPLINQLSGSTISFLIGTLVLALLINVWEESGQIGFLLPELQSKHGAVAASLIIAPMWAFMHLPALFVPDMGVGVDGPLSFSGILLSLGVLIVYAIPVRILATWLFNSVGQSVIIVALFHAAMNSMQGELQKAVPGYNAFYLLGAFAVVSVILIAVTRGRLGYKKVDGSPQLGNDASRATATGAQV